MAKRDQKYEEALRQLVKLLRRQGRTVFELCKLMECSRPTVYSRLQELTERGYTLKGEKVRAGSRGPLGFAFRIVAEPSNG